METKIKSSKCSKGITRGRWHQAGHAHCSFPQVGLKTTEATAALKPESEEERSGWGHACLHWWPSVLCIRNTISAKLSSLISHVCGNYDFIGLHNVLSNYWWYLFVYFYMRIYICIFSNGWHWCTQTKPEEVKEDARRRHQHTEEVNTHPLTEQQWQEQWACPCHAAVRAGAPGWCQQPSSAHTPPTAVLQPFAACGPLSILPQQLRPC